MALRTVYERFLAAPTVDVLSPNASWNYITTTTSVSGAEQIVKHFTSQNKIVKKKGDKTLSAIETADALVLDVETTLEFLTGGGAYLPLMDDNFLTDREVTFPTIHIVRFDSQHQIQQVRLYWDQASLLKQVEVIGSRGRSWPIRDANEQSKLISRTELTAPPPSSKAPSTTATTTTTKTTTEKIAAPYAPGSARPPPRDPSEIFVAEPEPQSTPRASIISPRAGADRHFRPVRVFGDDDAGDEPAVSPVKPKIGSDKGFQPVRVFDPDAGSDEAVQQPKAGSTRNFHAIRLFEEDDGIGSAPSGPEPRYKTNPNKFNHFTIGGDDNNEDERRPAVASSRAARPLSQWSFEDFNTPEKPRRKFRAQDVRHFGWSDNEDEAAIETPPPRPRVAHPRRDAQTHLNQTDNALTSDPDAEIAPVPQRRMIGSFHNKGLSLYDNNLYDEAGNPTPLEDNDDDDRQHDPTKKQPLGIVPNNAHRKKDFDAHWEVHDPSVEERQQEQKEKTENVRPVGIDRVKAVQMMTPSWDVYDKSPAKPATSNPNTTNTNNNNTDSNNTSTLTHSKRVSRAMFQPSWTLGDE